MRSTWHLHENRRSFLHRLALMALLGCVHAGCRPLGNEAPVSTDNQEPSVVDSGESATEIYEAKYPDGKVQRHSEVYSDVNGDLILHGETRTYFQSGEKQSLVTYVSGVRNGPRVAWYRNGTIRSRGQFLDGREHGAWILWYPNGQKAEEHFYDHGAYNGTFLTWHMSGKKKSRGNWTNGKRQGIHVTWDEAGDVFKIVEYVDNVAQP